jgi:hypothetical protein
MRGLSPAEVDAYDVLPRALAARVRIQRVPFLAPGSSGMTIGRVVLVRDDELRDGSRKIIAHELVHVRQYDERGVLRFLARYLADYARGLARLHRHRAAYYAIPFEEQAYAEADAWSARHAAPAPAPAESEPRSEGLAMRPGR